VRALKSILFGLLLGAVAIGGSAAAQDSMGAADAMGAHTVSATITNTTAHQTFSAPVLMAHDGDYTPFALGAPVYTELVPLAEDGMTGELRTVADVDPAILDYAIADGPLAPGHSVTLQVRVDDAHPLLSAFAMLVTTNDTVFYFGADLSMSSVPGSGAMGSASDGMASDGMASDGMAAASGGSERMGSSAPGSDAMGAGSTGSDQMASGADAMTARVDLYDGTVRALDAGSEADTESCADIPGPPCGSVGARHPDMAEGAVAVSHGLTGDGDLDPAVYGWHDPVATVSLTAP